jgi:hypothetical protein
MGEILLPAPLVSIESAKHGPADEISAEDEEDNDCLMAGRTQQIGRREQCAMAWKLRKIHEECIAPVFEEHENRGDTADRIQ